MSTISNSSTSSVPTIALDSEADVERSCNCCNRNICCFPFFRKKRHHRHNTETVIKVEKVYADTIIVKNEK